MSALVLDVLPPTIEGLLRDQQDAVWLHGVIPGLSVEIQTSDVQDFASGVTSVTLPVERASQRFAVDRLMAGRFVRCRSRLDVPLAAYVSPFSRRRRVASVPTNLPAPRLHRVEDGMEVVPVLDVRPGAAVSVTLVSDGVAFLVPIASGTGDPHRRAALPVLHLLPGDTLTPQADDGHGTTLVGSPVEVVRSVPCTAPRWASPLYAHQRAIRVWCGHPGAHLVLADDEDGRVLLGALVTREDDWYFLDEDIAEGMALRATLEWRRGTHAGSTSPPALRTVLPSADRPAPRLEGPVYAGQRRVAVSGQVPGGLVRLVRYVDLDDGTRVAELVGYRTCATIDEVDLGDLASEVVAGWKLVARTTLGESMLESEPVEVEVRQDKLGPPFIIPHLYVSGRAVLVARVERSATVEVRYGEDEVVGRAWTGDTTVVDVDLWPPLTDVHVTVSQQSLDETSEETEAAADATPISYPAPIVQEPVFFGDAEVVAVGVVPGSEVEVWWRETEDAVPAPALVFLGGRASAEPIATVPVAPVPEGAWPKVVVGTDAPGMVQVRVRLGAHRAESPWVQALRDPSLPGVRPGGTPALFVVDESALIGGHRCAVWAPGVEGALGADLSLPMDADGLLIPVPVVVMRHGDPPGALLLDSYLGYRYLAEHLATWGCIVVSIEASTPGSPTNGTDILEVSRAMVAGGITGTVFGNIPDQATSGPYTFFGHSNGGGAAARAAIGIPDDGVYYRPVGVVACILVGPNLAGIGSSAGLAPLPGEVEGRPIEFVEVTGVLDYAQGNEAQTGWFQLPRPRSMVWVPRVAHNPFNTVWATQDDRPIVELAPDDPAADPGTSVAALNDKLHMDVLIGIVTTTTLAASARYYALNATRTPAIRPAWVGALNATRGSRKLPGLAMVDYLVDFAPLSGPGPSGRIEVIDSFGSPVPEVGIPADPSGDLSVNDMGMLVDVPAGASERPVEYAPPLPDGGNAPAIVKLAAPSQTRMLDISLSGVEVLREGVRLTGANRDPSAFALRLGATQLVDQDQQGVWTTVSKRDEIRDGDYAVAKRGRSSDLLVMLQTGGIQRWVRWRSGAPVSYYPDVGGPYAPNPDGLYPDVGYYGGFACFPASRTIPLSAFAQTNPDLALPDTATLNIAAATGSAEHVAIDTLELARWLP